MRRQIIFPTPLAVARRKFGIAALDFFFEINAHARHDFQILDHGPADAVGNASRLRVASFSRRESFGSRSGSSTFISRSSVAALAHQVADALVHGDAAEGTSAGMEVTMP